MIILHPDQYKALREAMGIPDGEPIKETDALVWAVNQLADVPDPKEQTVD